MRIAVCITDIGKGRYSAQIEGGLFCNRMHQVLPRKRVFYRTQGEAILGDNFRMGRIVLDSIQAANLLCLDSCDVLGGLRLGGKLMGTVKKRRRYLVLGRR